MENGVHGLLGELVVRHVEVEPNLGHVCVTTQHQQMVELRVLEMQLHPKLAIL